MIDKSGEDALRMAMQGLLRGGTVVVLASVSKAGVPSTALCSWIVAKGPHLLAMALDKRSSAFTNVASGSNQIALEVMADDILLSIRGIARVERETLGAVPFPCALVMVQVAEIRDHMIGGLRFKGPRYVYEAGKEHRTALEKLIFDELQRA